jgi:TetR/AcrR family transcriptional regulator, transcriptional repressor for nem operon
MRYPADHKQRTSERILSVASSLFRKRGYDATGIDAVMASADLTAGAFYAHFQSKEDLLARSLESAFCDSGARWSRRLDNLRGRDWVRKFATAYLSKAHRDNPELGCPMPALASDIARIGGPSRAVFEQRLRGLIDAVGQEIGPDSPNPGSPHKDEAIPAIALCVGGLMLARAVNDQKLSDRILTACRAAVVKESASAP